MTSAVAKFRKRPIEIEAVRFTGHNLADIAEFIGEEPPSRHGGMVIVTLEGEMYATPGDWIIREPFPTAGRQYYPCKPDIFAATYEPLDADPVCPLCGAPAHSYRCGVGA